MENKFSWIKVSLATLGITHLARSAISYRPGWAGTGEHKNLTECLVDWAKRLGGSGMRGRGRGRCPRTLRGEGGGASPFAPRSRRRTQRATSALFHNFVVVGLWATSCRMLPCPENQVPFEQVITHSEENTNKRKTPIQICWKILPNNWNIGHVFTSFTFLLFVSIGIFC